MLAALVVGCGSDGGAGSSPLTSERAVHGLDARARLTAGGSITLMLGNPLSTSGELTSHTSVAFWDPDASAGTCSDQRAAGCIVSRCTGLDPGTPAAMLSAGAVTLNDGTEELVLLPAPDHRYPSTGAWESGESVAVSVEGAAVPGFESQTVIPERLRVLKPAFEQSFDFTVDRARPLDVSWTGGGDATVEVVILQAAVTGISETVNVVCAFPAADAQGSVAPAVLAELTDLATAQVTIAAVNGRVEQAGAFPVSVEAASYPFFGRATFR